jgi:hypothetical protein
MGVGSDTAGALHKMVSIPGIPALQNELNTPEHLPRAPGIYDLAAGHLDLNAEMTFNSRDWIYGYSLCHRVPPLFDLNRSA